MSRPFFPALFLALLAASVARAHDDHDHPSETTASVPAGAAHIVIERGDGPGPWTNLQFHNDPDNFQFLIVSDRTGGPRKGVFEDAVRKINLLRPEFVMSVGDLIQGYNDDPREIDRQWDEFQGFVKKLTMPFFFVPGNHDISNPMQVRKWKERFGRLYYHFVYRDVLFLCLNSDDGGPAQLSEEQIDYFRRVLDENKDVRWTLVFLHRPLWAGAEVQSRSGNSRFDQFDALLQGRDYTVFAGHWHQYTKWQRNGRNYFVLATTGGGSQLSGWTIGSFDHVVWCTMTDEGPIIANLMLDGIWDEDILTTEKRRFARLMRESAHIVVPSLYTDERVFHSTSRHLRLTNDADMPMEVSIAFEPHPLLTARPHAMRVTVQPNSVELLDLELSTLEPVRVSQLTPLLMHSTITYRPADQPVLEFRSRHLLTVESAYPLPRAADPVAVDGALQEWRELPYAAELESQVTMSSGSWLGREDGSFRFGVKHDEEFVYVGIEVTDDYHLFTPQAPLRQQDSLELRLDARPIEQRANVPDRDEGGEILVVTVQLDDQSDETIVRSPATLPDELKAKARKTEKGYDLEIAVPTRYLSGRGGGEWSDFRLNIFMNDADELGYVRDVISWKPGWRMSDDYANSGTFRKD